MMKIRICDYNNCSQSLINDFDREGMESGGRSALARMTLLAIPRRHPVVSNERSGAAMPHGTIDHSAGLIISN